MENLMPNMTASAPSPRSGETDHMSARAVPPAGRDGPPRDWPAMLMTNDKGHAVPGLTLNWTVLLEHHPDARGMLALDEFSGQTMLLRRPPWDLRQGDWKPRPVGNKDLAELVEWLEGFGLTPKVSNINPVIDKVAGRHPYHPVKDWLLSLPAWDGVRRVDTFLTSHLGADDTRLNRAFSRKWLSALAMRVFQPGCQFDHVLTLQGPQGLGKSSFGRALVPIEEWVTDGLTLGDGAREVIEITRGRWLVELAELAGRSNREIEAIRKFITIRVDSARGAYQYKIDDVPRQFVFYATTNADEFLTDTAGNRRWWPIRPTAINIAAIRADRDQIWAEVMTIYEREVLWLDDPALRADLETLHKGVMDYGPTYEIIRDLIPDGDMMVPCADMRKLLTGGSEDASRLPSGWRANLQRALVGLGFEPKSVVSNRGRDPVRYYVRGDVSGKLWARWVNGRIEFESDSRRWERDF
jgi:predicted P-loop ATPase